MGHRLPRSVAPPISVIDLQAIALRGVGAPLTLAADAWLPTFDPVAQDSIVALYSLIVTAKLNDVDPRAWLAAVLRRIADHPASRLHELLPWNWARKMKRRRLAA